jgi:hypothetical protein
MLPVIFFALIMIIIYSIFIRKADKTLWKLGLKPVVKLLVEELLYPIFFLLSFIQPRTVCLCLCLSTQTVNPAVKSNPIFFLSLYLYSILIRTELFLREKVEELAGPSSSFF